MSGHFVNKLTTRTEQPSELIEVHNDYAQFVSSARHWNIPAIVADESSRQKLDGFAKTGTIDTAASQSGVGVKGNGTTGFYSRTVSVVPQAMWIAVRFVANFSSSSTKTCFGLCSGTASGSFCRVSSGSGTDAGIIVNLTSADSGSGIVKVGAPSVVVGTTYTVVAVFPSNLKADAYYYVNGVKYAADAAASVDITFPGNTFLNEAIGALKRSTPTSFSSDTVLFTARGLGQIPEILAKQISENPYSLLQPEEQKVWVPTVSTNAAQEETGALVETSSNIVETAANVDEVITSVETSSNIVETAANVDEIITSVETLTSTTSGEVLVAEAGSAAESSSISADASTSQSESGTVLETSSADVGTVSASIDETGNVSDTTSVILDAAADQSEVATTTEISSIIVVTTAAQSEVGVSVDTSSASVPSTISVSQLEALTALDVLSAIVSAIGVLRPLVIIDGQVQELPAGSTIVDTISATSTNTLTNKRITARVGSATSSATPTINTDNYDIYKLTAQAVDITSFTSGLTGTPVDGDILVIEITGTGTRSITWGSSFESSTVDLPATVGTDLLIAGFVWNVTTSKWRCVAVV